MKPPRERKLDTRGKLCPQPILELAAALRKLRVGDEVELLSDDAAIVYDLPAWCASTGHELLHLRREGREHRARVRKMHDRTF